MKLRRPDFFMRGSMDFLTDAVSEKDFEKGKFEVWFTLEYAGLSKEEIYDLIECSAFCRENHYTRDIVMTSAFWYDLLTDKQKTELKRDYSLAIHAGEKEFTSLGQMWDTGYVTYLREYLRNRDAKNAK